MPNQEKSELANTDLFQKQSVARAGAHFPVPMLVHVAAYVFVDVEFGLVAVEQEVQHVPLAFLHARRIGGGRVSRNGGGRRPVHRYGDRGGGGGGRLAGNAFLLVVAVVARAQHRADESKQLLHVIVELVGQTDHAAASVISASGFRATFAAELVDRTFREVHRLVAPSACQQQSSAVLAAAPLLHQLLVVAAFRRRGRDGSCGFWWRSSCRRRRRYSSGNRCWCSFYRHQGNVCGGGGCGRCACVTAVNWRRRRRRFVHDTTNFGATFRRRRLHHSA